MIQKRKIEMDNRMAVRNTSIHLNQKKFCILCWPTFITSVFIFLSFNLEHQKELENAEALALLSVAIFPPILENY